MMTDLYWTEDLNRLIGATPEPYRSNLWQVITDMLDIQTRDQNGILRALQEMEDSQQERWKRALLALVRQTQTHFS